MFKHMTLIVAGLIFAGGAVAEVTQPTTRVLVGATLAQIAAAFIAYRKLTSPK